ncbi:MAG TPA: peptide-methionine (R)-S-oxide reductase [Verrucomicrobiales bacterium]|nr:peptide-methionine (R)-S-oxide reductase [Verrucomicrobiales bacterium]
MPKASPRGVLLVSMAGAALVLCGGLIVLMEYAKTELKKKGGDKTATSGPAGPFAANIKQLTPEAYSVTQGGRDQPGFFGKYVRTKEPGLYLDAVSGEVLFTSLDKLESTQGHAEFSKPFDPARLVEKEEKATETGELRLQVHSKLANTYLGWITTEPPPGGRRYVINSNALRFVPAAELEKHKLGQHAGLFSKPADAPPQGNGGTP